MNRVTGQVAHPLDCAGFLATRIQYITFRARYGTNGATRRTCLPPRKIKFRMRRIAILGSTGSIGRSTLNVAETYPERFQIIALAAGSNLEAAFEQVLRWKPRMVSMAREADADILRKKLKARAPPKLKSCTDPPGTVRVATHPGGGFRRQRNRRSGGAGSDLRGSKSRKDRRPCQQRMPGGCRRTDHRRGAQAGQAVVAHRQ